MASGSDRWESGTSSGRRLRLNRKEFLSLSGAGAMVAAGSAFLGADGYRRFANSSLAGVGESPTSLAQSLEGALGVSGGSGVNVVLVVMDSLRRDHIGIYGSRDVRTPNIDALASDGLRFTRTVPEAMPTIPARRSLYTGMRTFPFRDWTIHKGENVRLRGWQPIPEEQWTVAEVLQASGYVTMAVSDNNHLAKAGYNFQRGFDVFDYIRGQERDLYRPTWMCPEEKLRNTLMSGSESRIDAKMRQYFANTRDRRGEEDYFAPRVFTRAAEWLEGVRGQDRPFFMVVDSFDPHEPWDPPDEYVRMYGEGYDDYDGKEPYMPLYRETDYLEERDIERMKTLYAAEVTMVDKWFGRFMDRVESLGLLADTAIVLTSDHGVALGEHGTIGKPHYALWPEVTDVPFIIRDPAGRRRGEKSDYRASTHDVTPTVLGLTGVSASHGMDGRDLVPVLDGESPADRPHFTAGFNDFLVVRDDDFSLICRNDGSEPALYDIGEDPGQRNDIAANNRQTVERMYNDYALKDAGGEIPTEWPTA